MSPTPSTTATPPSASSSPRSAPQIPLGPCFTFTLIVIAIVCIVSYAFYRLLRPKNELATPTLILAGRHNRRTTTGLFSFLRSGGRNVGFADIWRAARYSNRSQDSVDLEKTLDTVDVDTPEIPQLSKLVASHAIPAPRLSRPLHPIPTRWPIPPNQPTPQSTHSSQKRITAIRFASPTKRTVEELNANPKLTPVLEIRALKVHSGVTSSSLNTASPSTPPRRSQVSHPPSQGSPSPKASNPSNKFPATLQRSLSDLKANTKLAPVQGPIKPLSVRRRSDSSPPSTFTRSCMHAEVNSLTRERRGAAAGKENASPLKRVPFY